MSATIRARAYRSRHKCEGTLDLHIVLSEPAAKQLAIITELLGCAKKDAVEHALRKYADHLLLQKD